MFCDCSGTCVLKESSAVFLSYFFNIYIVLLFCYYIRQDIYPCNLSDINKGNENFEPLSIGLALSPISCY